MSNKPMTTGDEPALGGARSADAQRMEPALGGEAALTHLIDTIHSEELEIRLRAVEQLAVIGSAQAVDLLEQAADDPNTSVRERAVRALGKIPHERAVDILLDKLQHESLSQVRVQVIRALGETGSDRAVDPLIEKLQSDIDREERRYAALALGRIGEPQAISALTQVLEDAYSVRRAAGRAIRQIGEKHPDVVQPLIDQLMEIIFRPFDIFNPTSWAFAALGAIRPAAAVPPLIDVVKDPERSLEQRLTAVSALRVIRDSQASAALLELFATTQNGRLRFRIAQALIVIRDREAIPTLIELLKHEDWHVRRYAVRILGRRDVRSAVPHLILRLEDSRAPVRQEAADALRRLHQAEQIPQAITPLIHALSDRVRDVQQSVARTLGRLAGPDAVSDLITLFQASNDAYLRQATMGILQEIGWRHPDALQDVMEVIQAASEDEDPRLAWYARRILRDRASRQ